MLHLLLGNKRGRGGFPFAEEAEERVDPSFLGSGDPSRGYYTKSPQEQEGHA